MNVLKRLLPYIILNVIVSALTTYAVLTWWNNNHSAQPTAAAALPTSTPPASLSSSNATPIPAGAKVIEIPEVIGGGNLSSEAVTIRRLGEGELSLNGWRLDDNAGHRFTFPDMNLYKGGSVRVFSKGGANTVTELYWGLKDPVWVSGKTAGLYDNQGVLRASFLVP